MFGMIIFDDVHFTYPSADEGGPCLPALCGVGLAVARGEFVAIVGRNGSGKSTLARHINALLSPDRGTVWLDGKNTRDETLLWEIRKTAAMVFQNPDNQLVATTVEEDVAFGPENLGVPRAEIRTRVDEALATVGMGAYARRAPHHLSGGQKQRVAIAGALAMRPQVLVLDEATAMLDPAGRREVLETARRLNRGGMTVLLITHDMEEAALAARLVVMENGEITRDATPREIFGVEDERQKTEDREKRGGERGLLPAGLVLPAPAALALALRRRGLIVPAALTVGELTANPLLREVAACVQPPVFPPPVPPDTPPVLEIRHVTYTYSPRTAMEKTALRDISLTLRRGERLAVIGHTGSGKSTLIQHFNKLLAPTSGEVVVRGRVGMVFQQPEHQLFEATVYRDVAFAPTRLGFAGDALDTTVRNALISVGLPEETWESSPFALSGGQKRRAAIAGVLAMQPEILVLDEPTAGLDPQGRHEILSLIENMPALTVVIVSHAMDDIARLCTRAIVLNEGEIAAEGTPAQLFANPKMLEEINLSVPPITKILLTLAETNPALLESLRTTLHTPESAAELLTTPAYSHSPHAAHNLSSVRCPLPSPP